MKGSGSARKMVPFWKGYTGNNTITFTGKQKLSELDTYYKYYKKKESPLVSRTHPCSNGCGRLVDWPDYLVNGVMAKKINVNCPKCAEKLQREEERKKNGTSSQSTSEVQTTGK